MDTIGTWLAVTGVAIECIVLGWLLLSEKPSATFFHETPRTNTSILMPDPQWCQLAREWGHLTARDLGQRLHRDLWMISQLAAAYAAHRDPTAETRLRQAITSRHPK